MVVTSSGPTGDDTGAALATSAEAAWAYLRAHSEAFARRKSSVYRGRPEFAMFGVGPYSFSAWKVAVSGLHKAPVFHVVGA